MSSENRTNRNRLIAGIAVLIVLIILIISSASILRQRRNGQPQVNHRFPIAKLTYCGPQQETLCIVSFSQEVDGAMRVNLQTPDSFYPKFYLTISYEGAESTYECQRVEESPTSVYCTGAPQVPGLVLNFKVISKNGGTVLAEGNFSIIGIALSTPEIITTGTVEGLTGTPVETPTAGLPSRTPTLVQATPTPTLATPSPSYPNPSYP